MKVTFVTTIAVCLLFCHSVISQNQTPITIKINGARQFQVMDGIGVNANTSSWNENEMKPAIDMLIDSMHATIWRVIVETVENWEEVNDNNDPFSFNWNYYNKVYETPKFRKVWAMMQYLNDRGISDNLMINFMGFAPQWMGTKVIEPRYEDEFVEMITSFFYYAIKTKHLRFGYVGPTNETEHHCCKEGPHLNGEQHARILRKFIDRMESLKIMGAIKLVAPDNANTAIAVKEYIPAMMKDAVVMSHTAHLGVHSYGGYFKGFNEFVAQSAYPNASYWVTEWNAWCQGCDEGQLGEYNYAFASKTIGYLIGLLRNGAQAAMAFEAYDSYYEHHAPSPFSYWGMLEYTREKKSYAPRKNFYAIQQLSRFVKPGSRRIFSSDVGDSLVNVAYYDSSSRQLTLTGVNLESRPVTLNIGISGLPSFERMELFVTDEGRNVSKVATIDVVGKSLHAVVPARSTFTITGAAAATGSVTQSPEPEGWYTGDIHVHRNCGDNHVVSVEHLGELMTENDLDVISLLADMGNGEVLYSKEDLSKVNGSHAPESKPGRLMQWDAEWHWDATYSNFNHQALGGHLVLLGLKEAHQIWDESPYKILEWARKQNAVTGFCHFQYLNDKVQNDLNCCIPIEYPVEAALGTFDFVSEDVFGVGSPGAGSYDSEAAMHAYYKLLNCGFRLGLAAGTDYPCNENEPLGTLLTYVQVKEKNWNYNDWVAGIKSGKTVVSRKGHSEFLDMHANNESGPGDILTFRKKGEVDVAVTWTSIDESTGTLELIKNGVVVGSRKGTISPGKPITLTAKVPFTASGWISARRMDETGHVSHTAPLYVNVNNKPVRASADDAQYFVAWIDNILKNIQPDGPWSKYFTADRETVMQRYQKARDIYRNIAKEAAATH